MPDGTDAPTSTVLPADHDRIYVPHPGENQLTVRAVLTGCVIGAVVGAMNISIGLKIGWSFGGSLIAAILGYAFWAIIKPKSFSVLETNIAQTSGSAAGSMASAAGLLAPIPALVMLWREGSEHGINLGYVDLTLWSLSVGFLGVFFAVPLRNQYVVVEKLRFPTGTATAETVVSIFAEGAEAMRKAKVLLWFAVFAALFVFVKYDWGFLLGKAGVEIDYPGHYLEHPPGAWLFGATAAGFVTAWGFHLLISPVMTGAGLLIGPRIGSSLLLGAVVSWLVLGWGVVENGFGLRADDAEPWVTGPIMDYSAGVRGWILWPGVAIMVADALTSLALSWRSIINTFTAGASLDGGDDTEQVPNSWWMGGLALGGLACVLVSQFVFGIAWWMTIIAIALSSVLAAIAVRSTGETDINPVGGMGKVTQLVFGGVAPGQVTTNLMAAAVSGSGASQAADMMQDLKTGYMLGASPRKQIIAQCCGIVAGILVVVPIFALFNRVYEIGVSTDYPAPAAHAWKAMAELLSQGFGAIPTNAEWAVLGGVIFGALMPILRRTVKPLAPVIPSGLAVGIAFIVPAYYSVSMFIGSMILVAWKTLKPKQCAALVFAVASGLLVGEGLMNVVTALITLAESFMQ